MSGGGWVGITDGKDRVDVLPDCSLPVTTRDIITPLVIAPFHRTNNQTTLTVATVIEQYSFTVSSTTGFIDGAYVILLDTVGGQFFTAQQVGAVVGNVVTVDRPITVTMPIGAIAIAATDNLNVDGSSTTQVFGITPEDIDVNVYYDITRIIITMVTTNPCNLSTFGDIATGITNGITIQHSNGLLFNVFNAKTNADFSALAYDLTFHGALNPAQGQDGLVCRITFNGKNKMGAVIRIGPGEDLRCLINDDLTSLLRFSIMAEGHIRVPGEC
jgi:hypothetical protein